jgi:hypothetical protein
MPRLPRLGDTFDFMSTEPQLISKRIAELGGWRGVAFGRIGARINRYRPHLMERP